MEGSPVRPDLAHCYQITCCRGEGIRVEEQGVDMVLISARNIYLSFIILRLDSWLYSQGKRDLNPRPEGLVLQPVSSLHYGEVSGEEDGGPLRHSHRGRDLTVVGVGGEAGSKRGQNRESAEDVTATLGPTFRIFCEVIRLLSDE